MLQNEYVVTQRAQRSRRHRAPTRSITIRSACRTSRRNAQARRIRRGGAGVGRARARFASRAAPARRDSIFNGADDDGSGTVALLEIAEAMAASPERPKRSILFISHTAEEEGLLGSAWFTDHPTVPRDSIVAEIDMDMIGRGERGGCGAWRADLSGAGRHAAAVDGVRRRGERVDATEPIRSSSIMPSMRRATREQYYCRADHYSYARYGIPSINFSRGDHPDYHEVTDEPQYIDYDAHGPRDDVRARPRGDAREPRPLRAGRQAEAAGSARRVRAMTDAAVQHPPLTAAMAQQSSFDVTTGVDLQEVDNAVNQAQKEIAQRYDFKGSNATIEFKRAEDADRARGRQRLPDARAVRRACSRS